MKQKERGSVIVAVAMALAVMTLVVATIVYWLQNDMKWSLNQQKSTDAINLAEAAINRGQWKLQSSTSTWAMAAAGTPLPGYNFDVTYTDIPGGTYRIKISSTSSTSVTIVGEGRDNSSKQTRAISAVFLNETIYSPMMSGLSGVQWGPGLNIFWGPIMTQGNLTLSNDIVAQFGFPRKMAGGVVTGTANYPRDTNGLAPPNTDGVEWWSNYQAVPPVPILDFATLRSSAAATGTLNVYGCGCDPAPRYIHDVLVAGVIQTAVPVAAWDTVRNPSGYCSNPGFDGGGAPPDAAPHTNHFGNPTRAIGVLGLNPNQNYVWYWDNDVTLEGYGYNGIPANTATSLRGTIIARGNLTINSSGDMVYTGHVPANAWMDQKELVAAKVGGPAAIFDTAATREYPADIGISSTSATWNFGTATWVQPGTGGQTWENTVGIQGFVYVSENLTLENFLDIHGAVWVTGGVTAAGTPGVDNATGIFFDDTLQVPTLNVILLRQSWQEVTPSPATWH